ncbi:MAG: hypothetical protein CVV44_01295 [Spirochaetae bacterium HGW-Spirochaetae-1]|nr:MAG: hypothetical protein CVV44_01295 [Spirochaetae bacterium HGW-Spirochaetae-1]
MMPIVLWTVFSLLNLIYLSIVSERVKTINTLVAMGSAVALEILSVYKGTKYRDKGITEIRSR